MLNKDTRKLPQFFCFRVRGFFSVKLRLDTNRNFALRGTTLPTCTQPAPILLPSLQLPSFSTLWDLPIYFLFTVRATYCNNLPKNQREVLDCCPAYSLSFFLPTIPQDCAQQEQHREQESHLAYTDHRQPASFFLPTTHKQKGAESASRAGETIHTCKSLFQSPLLCLIKVAQGWHNDLLKY